MMWAIRGMNYADLVANLGDVRCPCLVIHGAEDKWIPRAAAEELRDLLPNARLVEIAKTRHAPEVEDVDATEAAIRAFLESLGPSHQPADR